MARINKSRYAVMGILSLGPASGYQIKTMMANSTAYFWREGDSSIYPILKQLLDEGMVRCEIVENGEKTKKIYSLTEDGQQELQDWLLEDPSPFQARNEFLLKVFFGWNVPTKVILQHLEKYQSKMQEGLSELRMIGDKYFSEKPLAKDKHYRFLTLQAGLLHTEATLKWCETSIAALQKFAND